MPITPLIHPLPPPLLREVKVNALTGSSSTNVNNAAGLPSVPMADGKRSARIAEARQFVSTEEEKMCVETVAGPPYAPTVMPILLSLPS